MRVSNKVKILNHLILECDEVGVIMLIDGGDIYVQPLDRDSPIHLYANEIELA